MPPSLPTDSSNIPLNAEVLVIGLLLGIGAIFVFFPLLLRFLPGLRRVLAVNGLPISDVPGCPEQYDEALICALCTLPDPNNFLSGYTYLHLEDGIRFRHPKMPKCRYFSLCLYSSHYDPQQDKVPPSLCDHEIVYNDDGSFDVAICDEENRPADIPVTNWLPRNGLREGLLVVRRYGTLPGQRIDMPSFWTMHAESPKLVKPTYTTYSGPQYAEKAPGRRYDRLLNLLSYLGTSFLVLLFTNRWSVAEVNVMVLLAGATPICYMRFLYRKALEKARELFYQHIQGKLHEFVDSSPSVEYHANSPRPHPEHKYWVCIYDANQVDIVIDGLLFPGQQKMWTLVIYNEHGMPHYHTLTDETIHSTPTTTKLAVAGTAFLSSSSSTSTSSGNKRIIRRGTRNRQAGGEKEVEDCRPEGGESARAYRVVLTKDSSRYPQGGGNVVDVSGLPRGFVILRFIYPKSQMVFYQSQPSVRVVPVDDEKGSSKKQA